MLLGLASLMQLVPSTVLCEVGVVVDDQSTVRSMYRVGITDDSDPVGTVWARYTPPIAGRSVLNEDGYTNGDGRPDAAINQVSELPVVVWSMNGVEGYDVVISYFENDAWSTPIPLTAAIYDELDPVLAIDPSDGSVHVVYWVFDECPKVMRRVAPADLSSWTAPEQVSGPGEVASRPTAVFHNGALTIAYESHGSVYGSTPRQIVLATEAGGGFTYDVIAVSLHDQPNWPEVHSGIDKLWVDWIDGTAEMTWTRQQGSGSWDPIETEDFQSAEERDFHVRGQIKAQALE
jgi:hypothetical protein